jgi:hypothetical protein
MFLKYPIICSHVYCYSNKALTPPRLEKVQKRYEKQANARKYEVEYEVGQKVLLKMKNFTMPKGLTPKFTTKFASPLPIIK